MKIDIFCASQASTSVCLSQHHIMDLPSQPSSSSSAQPAPQLGGRAIDRHNPIIRDPRRLSFRATITPTLSAPCSSTQLPPINPTPYHQLQKPKSTAVLDPSPKPTPASDQTKKPSPKLSLKKKNKKKSSSSVDGKQSDYHPHHAAVTVQKSSATLSDFITPPGSTRYLLGDPGSLDGSLDYNEPVLGLVPVPQQGVHHHQQEKDDKSSVPASASKLSSSSRINKSSSDQMVVLRVSLHCKGCAEKLRKHLSRMEGVTSFNIDFAAKKVTVVGDVTPLSVLASVSKVKNAQFWTSAPSVVSVLSSENKKY
ncbi:protein SODIUM POTASSIUM ROOT DEFECTIVE 3-like [Punica granatum]|uniref:Protein SODIUM POTASSIUM ROOT DEFECTIVE 3-like n=1 Tax=Punica granatum TaxID=22663 RepID=A0A6P8DXC2_PUNGR|nr:protein SODIUM POTASSIUM ROOT DEFECTIVE 3-like [Punica granatum]